jgi:hypothetical protein
MFLEKFLIMLVLLCLKKTGWRDVDVRLILPDDVYASMGLGVVDYPHSNAKWRSLVFAWSAFGRQLTGLPIDFQIQQQTDANKKHKGPRSALFEREITEQDIIRANEN